METMIDLFKRMMTDKDNVLEVVIDNEFLQENKVIQIKNFESLPKTVQEKIENGDF